MRRRPRKVRSFAWQAATVGIIGIAGCATRSPLPPDAFIRVSLPTPQLPPPAEPAALPLAPASKEEPPRPSTASKLPLSGPLSLNLVLESVEAAFPLLYAIEQEREIAAGQRLTAEGQFDPVLRSQGLNQSGTFASTRFNTAVEQATPFSGISTVAGWRLMNGNFPVYYGDRKTADGGEFRVGVNVPLLQNREIDPRRARLRAAQITEQLADPVIRRARLDYQRLAAQAYWSWQAAGGQYRVAEYLLQLAVVRQRLLDGQFEAQLISERTVVLNRRIVASRREGLLTTERVLQQAALRLSLYLRDGEGNPVVPPPEWLLPDFIELQPPMPQPDLLATDVERAYQNRPELVRFQFEKERRTLELQLASNQLLPRLDAFANVAQDVGAAKKTLTGTGIFTTDRTTAEVGATFEFPVPLRAARGQVNTARAQLSQLLAQERYTRDEIAAQVQDAVSELDLTYKRLRQARDELEQAKLVLSFDTERFRLQQIDLIELNLQEIAAAEAQAKVVMMLGAYYSAVANYLAVLGIDNPRHGSGAVLPGGINVAVPENTARPSELLPKPREIAP